MLYYFVWRICPSKFVKVGLRCALAVFFFFFCSRCLLFKNTMAYDMWQRQIIVNIFSLLLTFRWLSSLPNGRYVLLVLLTLKHLRPRSLTMQLNLLLTVPLVNNNNTQRVYKKVNKRVNKKVKRESWERNLSQKSLFFEREEEKRCAHRPPKSKGETTIPTSNKKRTTKTTTKRERG